MVFTGRAVYDTGVFDGIAEDVSDIIGMISPFETPLLDVLGDSPYSANNVLHEWLEESLNPDTIVASSTLINSTNATAIGVHVSGSSIGRYMQVGAVLKNTRTGEYLQITATSTNTITVDRAFGGSSIATIAAGDSLFMIGPSALEGADVNADISRPRARQSNYCQIFKKDIIVSGTNQATVQLGNVADEYAHQKEMRIRESIRDLEKTVIQGKLSGNTLGSSSAYRTMRGLWDSLTTNSTSLGSLTPTHLNSLIAGPWQQGAGDLDIIIASANWKGIIDSWNTNRQRVMNSDVRYQDLVTTFESTFGTLRVILGRWMPASSLMVISSERVKVMPLRGRSFQHKAVAPTGDAEKGMVIGEYTLEVKNQEGMAKAYG